MEWNVTLIPVSPIGDGKWRTRSNATHVNCTSPNGVQYFRRDSSQLVEFIMHGVHTRETLAQARCGTRRRPPKTPEWFPREWNSEIFEKDASSHKGLHHDSASAKAECE